jgi:hypothetical protein
VPQDGLPPTLRDASASCSNTRSARNLCCDETLDRPKALLTALTHTDARCGERRTDGSDGSGRMALSRATCRRASSG